MGTGTAFKDNGLPSFARPHGISRLSFLVYLLDLRIRVTIAFWTLWLFAHSSAVCAFISSFCSSGYDFAIPSSRLCLTATNLGSRYGVARQLAPLWTFTTDWRHARHTQKERQPQAAAFQGMGKEWKSYCLKSFWLRKYNIKEIWDCHVIKVNVSWI